jgi:hypothetical protein
MKLQHRRFIFSLVVLIASFVCAAATCRAQLLPPGDFRGKSLAQWGTDYIEWGLRTTLGGQTLPNTVNGVRYLPYFPLAGDFVADVTIPQGTALLTQPFGIYGQLYDDGFENNPVDPIIDTIFEESTIRVTYNGNVVLEGLANTFPNRKSGLTIYPEPIPYLIPQAEGAIAATFDAGGINTIFDMLTLGNHTINSEFDSSLGTGSITYNITVVPEPATLMLLGSATCACMVCVRRRSSTANGQLIVF